MKIEVITGIHSNRKTKECKLPAPRNTVVKIDGKKIEHIDYVWLDVKCKEPVCKWGLGIKGETRFSLKRRIRRWFWKLKRRIR